MPIIKGLTIQANINPSCSQSLLNGASNSGFINEMVSSEIVIMMHKNEANFSSDQNKYADSTMNTKAKKNPNFLFDGKMTGACFMTN